LLAACASGLLLLNRVAALAIPLAQVLQPAHHSQAAAWSVVPVRRPGLALRHAETPHRGRHTPPARLAHAPRRQPGPRRRRVPTRARAEHLPVAGSPATSRLPRFAPAGRPRRPRAADRCRVPCAPVQPSPRQAGVHGHRAKLQTSRAVPVHVLGAAWNPFRTCALPRTALAQSGDAGQERRYAPAPGPHRRPDEPTKPPPARTRQLPAQSHWANFPVDGLRLEARASSRPTSMPPP